MRKIVDLNSDWSFTNDEQNSFPEFKCGDWKSVELPHTWNADDGQDGGNDYYRGSGYYFRSLYIPEINGDLNYYIEVGAASYDCTAYINDVKCAQHFGGYGEFCVDIGDNLRNGCNEIAIEVSNVANGNIYPQMADFTFYGGLHSGVRLITVPKVHFDLEYYGGSGVTVSFEINNVKKCEKPMCDREILLCDAVVKFNSYIRNASDAESVNYELIDIYGKTLLSVWRPAIEPNAELELNDVRLWNGVKDPYLYGIQARLVKNNEVLDEVSFMYGFRSFSVSAENGFCLNGVATPLRGVSRHEDRLGVGNALSFKDRLEDIGLIYELGANTVRTAHYQHSPDFYSLCDEFGIIVWAEIPYISRMLDGREAQENALDQLKELIVQNYNHPSICFWCVANEITIGGEAAGLADNIKELNESAKRLDPSRLTAIAQVTSLPPESELNGITDLICYNHYFGWYGGKLTDNEHWLDKFHQEYATRPIGLSEYGCEGIISYHNEVPSAGDYSEEYQCVYHEHMLKLLEARPWIWASYVWNMFDFGCDARDEGGVSGRNNKGLVTFDRKIKKDAFYLYKAYWSNERFVHICGKRHYEREGESTVIKVYSNADDVTLYINGELFIRQSGAKVFVFENVPLRLGANLVRVTVDGDEEQTAIWRTESESGRFALKECEDDVGVTNWFDGRVISETRLAFNERMYSVRDKVRELLQSEDAGRVLLDVMSSISGMKLKRSMLMIMAEATPEELISGGGAIFGANDKKESVLAALNAELQKIKKLT